MKDQSRKTQPIFFPTRGLWLQFLCIDFPKFLLTRPLMLAAGSRSPTTIGVFPRKSSIFKHIDIFTHHTLASFRWVFTIRKHKRTCTRVNVHPHPDHTLFYRDAYLLLVQQHSNVMWQKITHEIDGRSIFIHHASTSNYWTSAVDFNDNNHSRNWAACCESSRILSTIRLVRCAIRQQHYKAT